MRNRDYRALSVRLTETTPRHPVRVALKFVAIFIAVTLAHAAVVIALW